MNAPKPSAPTKPLTVQPSKAPRKDTWHSGLRVANRVPAETVVKLASIK